MGFDTRTEFRCQNLGILKIYNGYRYREFFIFMVVSEPVSKKFGTGKKSRNRYRSNLVSEKSLGTGIGKIWYRKKVPVSVSKIFSTGKKYRYRYRPTIWVLSHTGPQVTFSVWNSELIFSSPC